MSSSVKGFEVQGRRPATNGASLRLRQAPPVGTRPSHASLRTRLLFWLFAGALVSGLGLLLWLFVSFVNVVAGESGDALPSIAGRLAVAVIALVVLKMALAWSIRADRG